MPAFSVPVAYFLTPSIPAGASQKRLSANILLQLPLVPLPDDEPPLTPLQSRVAALWGDCLNLQGVTLGPDSDFLDMGGYGGYVWGAYAVFFIVMAFDAFAARTQRLRQLAQVRGVDVHATRRVVGGPEERQAVDVVPVRVAEQ